MDLEIRLDGSSLGITIPDPYRPDMQIVLGKITAFLLDSGVGQEEIDLAGLLPLMIRGVVGCEEGCPANAKDLVERGYGQFSLQYVEGGILTARTRTGSGRDLTVKLFPEF